MMSGSNYRVSYLQILETERRLKLSSILNIFADRQDACLPSIQSFVKSFSSPYSTSDVEFDLEPFLDEIPDPSTIECNQQVLQSLAFIAGYSIHQYLKSSKPCHICLNLFTVDKEFPLDLASDSEFKLLQLTDRGGLKYPSEPVLNYILVLWKTFYAIENDKELLAKLVGGPSRKILV